MYGTQIGGVTRTRSYVGESGGGFALTKAQREQLEDKPGAVDVDIIVQAHFDGETYAIVINSDGRQATLPSVKPEDLASEIARCLKAVSKATADGTLTKARHGVGDSSPFGMGTPTSGRSALRF